MSDPMHKYVLSSGATYGDYYSDDSFPDYFQEIKTYRELTPQAVAAGGKGVSMDEYINVTFNDGGFTESNPSDYENLPTIIEVPVNAKTDGPNTLDYIKTISESVAALGSAFSPLLVNLASNGPQSSSPYSYYPYLLSATQNLASASNASSASQAAAQEASAVLASLQQLQQNNSLSTSQQKTTQPTITEIAKKYWWVGVLALGGLYIYKQK